MRKKIKIRTVLSGEISIASNLLKKRLYGKPSNGVAVSENVTEGGDEPCCMCGSMKDGHHKPRNIDPKNNL